MKHVIYLLLLLLACATPAEGQQFKSFISMSVIPYTTQQGNGTGIEIGYGKMVKEKFTIVADVGIMYSNFHSGLERRSFSINGQPLPYWPTELDVYMPERELPGFFINSSDFAYYNNLGLKHYLPMDSYRLNRYFSIGLGKNFVRRKIGLSAFLSALGGLTNREDTILGFTGSITAGASSQQEPFWITFNFRSRYAFLGNSLKLRLDYSLTDRCRIGATTGLQLIYGKDFREDDKFLYTGVGATVLF